MLDSDEPSSVAATFPSSAPGVRRVQSRPGEEPDPEEPDPEEPDRHRAAVARTLASARESAARGDYADALSWLSMLDAIGQELSDEDEGLRAEWRGIVAARPAAPR